ESGVGPGVGRGPARGRRWGSRTNGPLLGHSEGPIGRLRRWVRSAWADLDFFVECDFVALDHGVREELIAHPFRGRARGLLVGGLERDVDLLAGPHLGDVVA